MTPSPGRSLPLLFAPSTRRVPGGLEHMRLDPLRKAARTWLDAGLSSLPREDLISRLRKALEDDAAAARVLRSLTSQERAVAAAYARYGGSVDGQVIRLDLMARGLLEIIERKYSEHYIQRQWKQNPITAMVERWILLSEEIDLGYSYSSYSYGSGPDSPLPRYSLHAGIARRPGPVVDSAGGGHPRGHHPAVAGRGGPGPVPGLRLPGGPRLGQGPEGRVPGRPGPPGPGEGRAPGRGCRSPAP